MKKLLILFSIILTKVNAYPIQGTYGGFLFVTSSSGWLYCIGKTGVCANVIGDQIYFGNYVGNWYGVVSEEGDNNEYFVEDVTEN